MSRLVKVELPSSLCRLAGIAPTQQVVLSGSATLAAVIDALELAYPALTGTLRDPATGLRRPFIRFFAEEQDLSQLALDEPLPEAVSAGRAGLLIIGAIAGG